MAAAWNPSSSISPRWTSVRTCADALDAAGQPFDSVIANAGVMECRPGTTADGFETQFGTNHLGHFVLVNRIASLLKPGSRLVNLSSAGHRFADVDLDDPNFERTPYTEFGAYGRSKTANILFAVEFDRRHKARGVRATAVHPGRDPDRARPLHDAGRTREQLIANDQRRAGRRRPPAVQWKTIPQGAATSVWAGVVAPADEVGGHYCEDCHVAEIVEGRPASAAASAPMRSIPSTPRRSGPRARRWSANASENLTVEADCRN